MTVRKPNLVKYDHFPEDIDVLTKVRYKDKGTMSHLSINANGEIDVEFMDSVKGIAPGQSAVFYEGNDLLGGGFISA